MKQQHTNEELRQLDEEHYLQVFKRTPIALVRGRGCHVVDADGVKYLDALAGIAVNSLGHCHPAVVRALTEQAAELMHISNFYVSPAQALLAARLTELSGLSRAFMTNSGGESVETAVKLARKHSHAKGRGGEIISFEGCFHGRTMATIAAANEKYQRGFEPMPAGFTQVPFNDIVALRSAVSDSTAAILLEPVQGEGGIRPASRELIDDVRWLCDETGVALIFDEVQCGIARTGRWFAFEHYGVRPDILALAKGLGAGFPVGAVLCTGEIAAAIEYGDHGTTFGGNPLACSCALAAIDVIEHEGLLNYAAAQGRRLVERLESAARRIPCIRDVRGMGLMIGVELSIAGAPVVKAMLDRRVLSNCTQGNVIRLVPPLNTPAPELDRMTDALLESIREVAGNAST